QLRGVADQDRPCGTERRPLERVGDRLLIRLTCLRRGATGHGDPRAGELEEMETPPGPARNAAWCLSRSDAVSAALRQAPWEPPAVRMWWGLRPEPLLSLDQGEWLRSGKRSGDESRRTQTRKQQHEQQDDRDLLAHLPLLSEVGVATLSDGRA